MRSPAEAAAHKFTEESFKDVVVPFDPYLQYQQPQTPVQDEAIWANLDRSWKNLCPANVHGMKCPGMDCYDKTRVWYNMRPHPHVSARDLEVLF